MKVDERAGDTVWRDRAIERSTRNARERAAKRVQQFLDAARDVIAAKASTEFTVQEVVDQSKQSVRSFYQYFDSKHELLLVLFEEEMGIAVARIREATADGDPLNRLERVVLMLYDLCAPGRVSEQPLFAEFAQRLLVDHPEEVVAAYAPATEYVAEIVELIGKQGLLREGRPRRLAAIVLQTATVTAGRSTGVRQPITGDEVWQFCLHAIVPDHKLS
ncbi:MAG: TetR/AcrR family transcriptional regulator [Acidimicrobiia bacterium]|nr:TetR/AcrR family transcriptional regulator [Acidimicrobiia bacterium]MCY4433875.1 TetR/AcrR family transcriptional regulator [bacterium]